MCAGRWPVWAEVLPEQRRRSSDGRPSEPPEPRLRGHDLRLCFYPALKAAAHIQDVASLTLNRFYLQSIYIQFHIPEHKLVFAPFLNST